MSSLVHQGGWVKREAKIARGADEDANGDAGATRGVGWSTEATCGAGWGGDTTHGVDAGAAHSASWAMGPCMA
jgi:hypothetical protein